MTIPWSVVKEVWDLSGSGFGDPKLIRHHAVQTRYVGGREVVHGPCCRDEAFRVARGLNDAISVLES